MPPDAALADPAPPPTAERANLALLVAGLGIFMVFLDTQILFVAFGDIEASFSDVSTNTMSWVLSGYTLVFAALLVPAGRLADRWGRKRMFLGGLLVFTSPRRCAGWPRRAGFLIAARLVQAVGAAAITPTSLALVLRATPQRADPDRRRHLGLDGRGGRRLRARRSAACSSTRVGWRWVFFVNLPVCVVALIAGRRVLVESREADPGPFPDLVGSGVLALGVGAVSLALVQSDVWGWVDARTIGAIVIGLVLGRRCSSLRSRTQAVAGARPVAVPHPELPLGQPGDGRVRALVHGDVPRQRHVPHDVWGWGIVKAGIAMAPGPLVVLVLARRFGRLAARIGTRPLIITGGLVYALGGVILVTTVDETPNYATSMLPAWLLTGLGVALALPQLSSASVQGLPPDRYALGSAVNQTMRQLGATFGVALVVSFIAGATAGDALSHFQRAWWMVIACGTLTSVVAFALPHPVRATATAPAVVEV